MPPPKKRKKLKVNVAEAKGLVPVSDEPDPETEAVEVGPSLDDQGWKVDIGEAAISPLPTIEIGDGVVTPLPTIEIGDGVLKPRWDVDIGEAVIAPGRHNSFGAVVPGNIDLTRRPHVMNADGSRSTVRSMGINPGDPGGNEVLIPTVSDDGHIMTDEEAILKYELSGRHLGEYPSIEASNAAAEAIHRDQMENMPADTLDQPMSRTVPFQGIPSANRYTGMFAKGGRR
jgi:hypothetical protein